MVLLLGMLGACVNLNIRSAHLDSTSSKKHITPGRVQIHRNPFDRFLNSHNGPSQVRINV